MEKREKGIEKGSQIFFNTPTQTAKKLLYYPIVAGEYYCNSEYCIEREQYDSILLLFVAEGSLTLVQDGEVYTAQKNELLLVDGYRPHKYFTKSSAHSIWIHFDGAGSREWFEELAIQKGQKIKGSQRIIESLKEAMFTIVDGCNEYELSNRLYTLLCSLALPEEKQPGGETSEQMSRAKEYLKNNIEKEVTIEEVAGVVHLSPSYFSKVFKASCGFSPYDYLLRLRLEKAKELLINTGKPIGEIAYRTGFNSQANFIYFFKKQTGFSPLKFRKLKF